MAVNMNEEKPLQNMMMDYSIHKGSFLNFIAPNSFFLIKIIHTVIFHLRGWEAPLSRNRLPEISKF